MLRAARPAPQGGRHGRPSRQQVVDGAVELPEGVLHMQLQWAGVDRASIPRLVTKG